MKPLDSFIAQPIRSLQTMLRVLAEDDPRHMPVIPDGIYGPETGAAVARFQRLHGFPPSGVTDQDTWEAVVEEYNAAVIRVGEAWPIYVLLDPGQVIRRGERHPNLYLVQSMLKVIADTYSSITPPAITGLLDDATANALGEFQRLSGLPMTGHLDKITWKHLALQYPLASNLETEDIRR